MNFEELGLSENVLRAVTDAGYTQPTPIQAEAIPQLLMGRDLIGCAQTGTGKTASFTLPIIEHLASGRSRARMPRAIILEPTRELALQVSENVETYGKYHKLTSALLIGGERFDEQVNQLMKGVDILIATPGRILDLIDRGNLMLNDIKIFVIDEADRMLDMGFIPDINKIASMLPMMRQTVLFSATMPPEIRSLAQKYLNSPKEITVAPPASPAKTVEQQCAFTHTKQKRAALRVLLNQETVESAFIFCNRKRDVGIVARSLQKHGYSAASLHGDMPQYKRTETLEKFRSNDVNLLVCSDVAARGIDVQNVSHVFNFDVPMNAEDYVHRIGRTGRAGKEGKAFTLVGPSDLKFFEAVEKLISVKIPQIQLEGIDVFDPNAEEETQPSRPQRKQREPRRRDQGTQRSTSRYSNNQHDAVIDDHNFNKDTEIVGFGDHVPYFIKVNIKDRKKHTVHRRRQNQQTSSETPKDTVKETNSTDAQDAPEVIKIDIVTTENQTVKTPETVSEEASTPSTKTETTSEKASEKPTEAVEAVKEQTNDEKKKG